MSDEQVLDGVPPTAPEATATDWRASLPDDLRQSRLVQSAADLEGFVNRAVNAQELIGRKRSLPTADSPAEAWDDLFNALGRPNDPGGYALAAPADIPDGIYNQEAAAAFADVAHKAGLTPAQATAVHDWYAMAQADAAVEAARQADENAQTLNANIARHWGHAKDMKLSAARRAAEHFGFEGEQLDMLEKAVGSFPMLDKFAKIGALLGEDQLIGDGAGPLALTPDQASAKINSMLTDPSFLQRYLNKQHAGHDAAVAEIQRLYEAKNSSEGTRQS